MRRTVAALLATMSRSPSHVVMIPVAWRHIFDQHELFQEIETNDLAVYLESGNDRR
jgi:hypothetical protein